jgi:hypothetical protein
VKRTHLLPARTTISSCPNSITANWWLFSPWAAAYERSREAHEIQSSRWTVALSIDLPQHNVDGPNDGDYVGQQPPLAHGL